MNPPTYDGAYPLDPALAGRFTFIIPMPEVCDMDSSDVQAIICSRHNGDAPALPRQDDLSSEETGALLLKLLSRAREQYSEVEKRDGPEISRFLARFNYALANRKRELALDGRRLAFMYRGIISILALRIGRDDGYEDISEPHDVSFFLPMINWMLPYPAMAGQAPTPHAIEIALTWALQEADEPERVVQLKSCAQAMRQFTAENDLSSSALSDWVKLTLEDLGNPDLDRRADAAVSLACLASLAGGEMNSEIPPSWRARILRTWRLWTKITPQMLEDIDLVEAIRQGPLASSSEGSPDDHLAILLALHVSQDSDSEVTEHHCVYPDKAHRAYIAIRARIDEMKKLLELRGAFDDESDFSDLEER